MPNWLWIVIVVVVIVAILADFGLAAKRVALAQICKLYGWPQTFAQVWVTSRPGPP